MSNTELSDANANQKTKPEQVGGFPVERHPNLTLLESGQNPGEHLRLAREKAGYSLSDISAQTKINERQLMAIESGDVNRLPPGTFAKAFVKSYCKALKIDPAPILLSFGFAEAGVHPSTTRGEHAEGGKADSLEPKMPSSSKRLSTLNFDQKSGRKSLGYGVALAAVAIMAVFYIPVFMSGQQAETVGEDSLEPVEAPAVTTAAPSVGIDTPVTSDTTLPLANQVPGAAGEAPLFPALQQPATPPAAPLQPATPAATSSAVVNSAAVQPVTPPVSGQAAQAQLPVAAPAAAATPSSQDGVLKFSFQEQSWVTVRDSSDKVLVSQLNDSGSNLEVRGQGPFKLIVGNAKSVNVSSNGKPVDLASSIRGEVARLTVQ